MKTKFQFQIPDYKKIRIIIDTDAACEADDPFAIVQALLSPKAIVKAILAEHFNVEGSVERSYKEIQTILKAMDMQVPVYMGEKTQIQNVDMENISPASQFIIEEALKNDEKPLYILCQGAITNLAVALKKAPEIASKINVIWIGTHGLLENAPFREFNAGNDVTAANLVLSSKTNLIIVPSTVYTTVTVGLAELQLKVLPYGEIGKHLFTNMIDYNNSPGAGWTKGESWSLGDSPAIAIALNPDSGHFIMHEAPFVNEDTSSSFNKGNPIVRIYTDIDSRYILEDFYAKLQINYKG